MDFNEEELLASLKEDDIIGMRSVLIGCLDEDQLGDGEPQTLKMVKYLESKMSVKLFEEDNGYFDFNSPMTEDVLIEVKSRLQSNFSRKKLEFAIKIIAFLKQSEQKNVKQQPVVEEKTKTEENKLSISIAPSAEVVVPKVSKDVSMVAENKSVEKAPELSTTNSSARNVEDFTYPETPQASMPSAQNATLPGGDELSLSGKFSQESQQEFSEETSSKEIKDVRKAPSGREKQTTQGKTKVHLMDEPKSPGKKQEDKEHQQGFFERKFAKVGRIMDNFFRMMFRKK